MELNYREMTIGDYEAAFALWQQTEGMGISEADEKPNIAAYLARNPGLSFVCEHEGKLVGTILCGHDGRRGFIYHAAVRPDYRGHGIGRQLTQRSLEGLREAGVHKCHLFVLEDNQAGGRFWGGSGWSQRSGILLFSRNT
ncbi:ribosomal protein S18 acetylase RimI-like enzyme [Paenibacillus phyllosphaerae]|uniref:Ribosomal protein S18 acetylase RimI-like enzyme n=1 Tax=Paenibacillus phyllosphaerae TaxID=274593 RepID=A0A7W5B2H8_9BACL|nr:GNAT family N-acetyltransferase [Paenibacillus phyllosphaerae]MBB3112666.1 ribosomal protein S18 acetylase RimI-like enzyme [Paenibacillus phyllosphaerae]